MVEEVFSMSDNNLVFEWSEIHVYKHPANPRKYAIDADSGCSCNSYEEPPEKALREYPPLTKVEARKEVADWAEGCHNAAFDARVNAIEAFNMEVK